MRALSEAAAEADGLSRAVLDAAEGSKQEAATLRTDLDAFLTAMRSTTGDRRAYERLPGLGAVATLLMPEAAAAPPREAEIEDLGRGGISLRVDLDLAPGTMVRIRLPGSETPVGARVARRERGILAFSLRQDEAALRLIDRA